jgi:hypothetical protein
MPRQPLEAAAFCLDDQAYTFSDVLVAGALCGEWTSFLARARRRQRLAGQPAAGAQQHIAQQVVAFRRARGLEAASDLRSWLGDRGLGAEDLVRHARALSLERAGTVPPPSRPGEIQAEDVDWWPDAVLGGDIGRWAHTLERWVVASSLRPQPAEGRAGASGELAAAVRTSGVLKVASGVDQPRLATLVHLALGYRAWAESAVDDAAIERLVRRKHLDWTWLSYDAVTFSSESAAWEAALCVREDGEQLADVAARAGASAEHRSGRQENMPATEAAILMTLAPGEVGGPAISDGEPVVLMLRQALVPGAHDGEIRELARAELIGAALQQAAAGRTRRCGKW